MATPSPRSTLLRRLAQGSLVKQILIGLVLGVLLATVSKPAAVAVGLLGTLFVGALKAVAPVLVLMLGYGLHRQSSAGAKNQHPPDSVPLSAGDFCRRVNRGAV